MKKFCSVMLLLALCAGCSNNPNTQIPVVNAKASSPNGTPIRAKRPQPVRVKAPEPDENGVIVAPQQESAPLRVYPSNGGASQSSNSWNTTRPASTPVISAPPQQSASSTGSGGGDLAADEQLDGPVLALLTAANSQEKAGNLNGAASNLERAQRVAPQEPQVLFRLAQVRLAQGDAAQAEQLARRGLSYVNGRPALQASLWGVIADARQQQGDSAGAQEARQRARSSS